MAGLIRELRARGLEASQRYQISEASYRAAKSPGARLFLRFRQYAAYPVQLMAALGKRRLSSFRLFSGQLLGKSEQQETGKLKTRHLVRGQDVIVVSTNTFYAPLIATYLHPNVVHLVYDLFPEAMIHSGKWQEGSLKVKIVRWITRKTLQRASVNVFLGERLKQYVESIHGDCARSAVIAVGADQSLFPASPKQRLGWEGGKVGRWESELGDDSGPSHLPTFALSNSGLSVLYCGNFGNMHDSATLFDYWWRLADSPSFPPSHFPTFNFFCSGPKRAAMESMVQQLPESLRATITIGGGLSQEEWTEAMEAADVVLVTMTPGAETVVIPSKTYSAMMAGQAILAIAPENSDLVDLIQEADCGWWVEPGDVDGLAAAVQEICEHPEALLEKRERAYAYAHAHFGQDRLADKWVDVLRQA